MRKYLSLAPLALLTACAVGPGLQTRMASYTGASTETLIKTFGVPDKQITVGDVQYLAYDEHHIDIVPDFETYGAFYRGPIFAGGLGSQIDERACETTFALRHGKVIGFTLHGNDCS